MSFHSAKRAQRKKSINELSQRKESTAQREYKMGSQRKESTAQREYKMGSQLKEKAKPFLTAPT